MAAAATSLPRSASIQSPPKVFGSPDEVLRAGVTIRRLDALYTYITEDGRQERILREIGAVWREARAQLARGVDYLEVKTGALQSSVIDQIADIYEEFKMATTKEAVTLLVDRFLKDIDSLQGPPLQKSAVGDNGPTLLVRYPRRRGEKSDLKKYVFKRVGVEEIECNVLYNKIVSVVFEKGGLVVPESHAIHLNARVQIRFDGTRPPIEPETAEALRKVFKPYGGGPPELKSVLMFMKYVTGENFRDFVRSSKYKELTIEQKRELFKRIGALSLLDVLLGNTDRFPQIFTEVNEDRDEQYKYDDLGSNLGNVMIRWDSATDQYPLLYVIDNLIESRLFGDKNSKKAYNHFITSQLNRSNFAGGLSRNILDNLSVSLDPEEDEALQPIAKDLLDSQLNLKGSLERGVSKAMKYIDQRLIPLWDDVEARADLVRGISEPIIAAVEERFKIFKGRKTI